MIVDDFEVAYIPQLHFEINIVTRFTLRFYNVLEEKCIYYCIMHLFLKYFDNPIKWG